MKTEAKFQTEFGRWLQATDKKPAVYELKITRAGTALSFSAVKDHQIAALYSSKKHGLYYKIPDVGPAQKPFDCFYMHGVGAFVVVQYYERGVKHFYRIDILDFIKEKQSSKRKSLTEERAAAIGKRFVLK